MLTDALQKQGIFTWEIIVDTLVYGVWMAALCLASFSLVLFGWGDGNLASGCNSNHSAECSTVYRARATTFVCMTWFALFLAWEMMNMRRSFFDMHRRRPMRRGRPRPRRSRRSGCLMSGGINFCSVGLWRALF